MPRRPRLDQPRLPQHVIQRGNNRCACFFADDDYYCYLHWLRKAAHDYGVDVHAYVLMTNHVHLLATPGKQGAMAKMMQRVERRYVCYVNATYKRSGTLWEGRFKAGAVDAQAYLPRVYRYELDPEEITRIRTSVNLGIGVDNARFSEQRRAAEQAKRKSGRKSNDANSLNGDQVDLF